MVKKKTEDSNPESHMDYHVLKTRVKTRSVSLAAPYAYPRWVKYRGKCYLESQPWYGTKDTWYDWGVWDEVRGSPVDGITYTGRTLMTEEMR